MVLSRQTGIEEKLGTPSLRQHAMPSPLHPPLALLLLSSTFPSFVSNLTIPAPHCPRDFLLLSLTPHLIFTSHPTLFPPSPSPALTPPSCLSLPPHIFFAYPNRSCSVLPHHKARAKAAQPYSSSPPIASSLSYGGRQSPAPRLHWGRGVRIQPRGPAAVN